MPTHSIRNLNAVSQTLLIPLYFRAMESQRPDALVRDPKAVELVGQLDCDFSGVQKLKNEQVNFLLRMREFDRQARAFLAEHPDGVIVDLGCGLDTRFERVDNGQVDVVRPRSAGGDRAAERAARRDTAQSFHWVFGARFLVDGCPERPGGQAYPLSG